MLKRSFLSCHWRTFSLTTMLMWAANTMAHTLPISFLTLVPDEGELHLELTVNPFELTFFSELDANRNGYLEPLDWQGQGEKIAWRILDAVKVRVDGRRIDPHIAGLTQTYESHHITVRAHYAVDARQAVVSVESDLAGITSGAHLTQVSLGKGDRAQAARLDVQSNQARFEPTEKPDLTPTTETISAKLGSSGQHEWIVMLLVTCIVSVLLMSMGSVALLTRRFVLTQSKAPVPALQTATQFQKIQ